MNKQEFLQELSEKIQNGEITRDEVFRELNISEAEISQRDGRGKPRFSHVSATKILYGLGAVTVIIGIIIFFGQIWEDIGSFGRIAVTLGLGLVFAVLGSMLFKQKPKEWIGAVFHTVGGILIPLGAVVTLGELGQEPASLWPFVFVFGILSVFYFLLTAVQKHSILTFFTIANATTTLYFLTGAILDQEYFYDYTEDIFAYLTMMIGACYLLLAHAFQGGWNKKLFGVLVFFGSGGILLAAFSQVFDSLAWELLYFPLVFGGILLSVSMKSRIILVLSMIFLVVHVSYITGEYFADSLGWPIALVILGLIFIGLGYASVAINKKYIQGAMD